MRDVDADEIAAPLFDVSAYEDRVDMTGIHDVDDGARRIVQRPDIEAVGSEQRNLLARDGLSDSQRKIYELLSVDEPRHIDDIVETSGLNSSEVLATLFDLEMKGLVRQLPGKQFSKVLL